MSNHPEEQAAAAAKKIHSICALRPTLAMVLGSGFQGVTASLNVSARIDYEEIPGFATPTVGGHPGELVIGELGRTPVVVLNGRIHYYEGHPMAQVTFPIRVLAAAGVRDLLLTNAAGGINRNFRRGDLMLITDHINATGDNPLRGFVSVQLPRFVDLTAAYNHELNALLRKAARRCRTPLRAGVYVAVSGPSYETPAEIRALARIGADAVGMSTVPETIVARQCGLRVAALSCITNLAAGRTGKALSHAEVLETGQEVTAKTATLLRVFAELYAEPSGEKTR